MNQKLGGYVFNFFRGLDVSMHNDEGSFQKIENLKGLLIAY